MTPRGAHFVVTGRVQGVGFRAFVLRKARALGVDGWVRNLRDGSVETCAQGTPEAMEAFAAALRTGPSWSRVDRVEVGEWCPEEDVNGFEVRPTR